MMKAHGNAKQAWVVGRISTAFLGRREVGFVVPVQVCGVCVLLWSDELAFGLVEEEFLAS